MIHPARKSGLPCALRLGLLAWLAAGTLGCAMLVMSPESEVKFGREVQTEIEKQVTFVRDPEIVSYVRKVGSIVTANSPQAALVPTEFFVIKNDEINAFAIPGGNIYVHTGLLNAAGDEAELAAVLSHEYGHVVYRHGAKHYSRAQGVGIVEQLLLGGETHPLAKAGADLAAQWGLQFYSRQDELEADSIAIPTLYGGGYDPHAMASFFETLKQRYGDQNPVLTLFASHPATAERIARVEEAIAKLPPKEGLGRPVNDLRKTQGRLQDLGLAGK